VDFVRQRGADRRRIVVLDEAARMRPWHVVGAIGLVYVAATLIRFDGDPRAFAVICPDPARIASGQCGYDGQFVYAIAVDPANAAARLDVPAYRFQRIVYPMLARALGLGQPTLIAWTLIAVNLVALMAGTAILESLLVAFGASRWYAPAYGLFAGTLMPVRLDLTEPLAYALALGGVWAVLRSRVLLSGALFALAALTKETTLVMAAGAVTGVWVEGRRGEGRRGEGRRGEGRRGEGRRRESPPTRAGREAMVVGVMAVVPFVVWQLVLRAWFGEFGVGSGGALGTPFEVVPLRGWWSLASIDVAAFALISLIVAPMAIVPALAGAWQVLRDVAQGCFDVPGGLLLANAVVVLFTPQSTFREPLGMARFAVGLVASTLVYAAARRSSRGLNYALLWITTLALAVRE
jgi:hypothetical protein